MKKARLNILCFIVIGGFYNLLIVENGNAQQHEVGFGLGAGTYTGDIIRRLDPTQVGLQGTLFGRRNFDNAWSLRAGLSVSRLNAADSIRPIDPVAQVRNAHFSGTALELAALMEFHFLDFLSPQSVTKYSPYGFLGLGYTVFSGSGQSHRGDPGSGGYLLGTPVIPLGIGIKYQVKPRLFLSLEFGARATFTDHLDKIALDNEPYPRFVTDTDTGNRVLNPNAFNFGNKADKDWYYFLGVTLSYSFHQYKCYTY